MSTILVLSIPLLQFQNFKDVSMIQIILAGLSWFVLLHTILRSLWLVEKYFYQKNVLQFEFIPEYSMLHACQQFSRNATNDETFYWYGFPWSAVKLFVFLNLNCHVCTVLEPIIRFCLYLSFSVRSYCCVNSGFYDLR